MYYRSVEEVRNRDLRPLNLEIDIKAGTSHVLLPPSRHSSRAIYALDNCVWSDFGNIPPFLGDNLNELIAGTESPLADSGFKAQRSTMQGVVTEGTRGLTLNDRLCAQVGFCDSFDDLLAIARDENEKLIHHWERPKLLVEPKPFGMITSPGR